MNRNPPSGNYTHAAKNIRSYAAGENMLPQGIITDPQQNVHNVEHIIKYLNSDAFNRKIEGIVNIAVQKALGKKQESSKNENESGETKG